MKTVSNNNFYERYWDSKTKQDSSSHASHVPSWNESELNKFYRAVQKFIGANVLDVGAGEGVFDSYLYEKKGKNVKISALEISKLAIKRGKKMFPWLHYSQSSAENVFPYRDREFDTVFMLDVIEHLVDVDMALDQCNRVLRKGGKLIIITPDFNFIKKIIVATFFWEKMFYPNNPHVRFFTHKSIREIMGKHGFRESYYSWGLSWFGIMPQNMYAVYEKR